MTSDALPRAALALALARLLAACGSGDSGADAGADAMTSPDVAATPDRAATPDVTRPPGTPAPIDWGTNGERLRGSSAVQLFTCPPNGRASVVFGTGVYAEPSAICLAAVHDRRITMLEGGVVGVQPLPGMGRYMGSAGGGGITSGDWDMAASSFSFVFPGQKGM